MWDGSTYVRFARDEKIAAAEGIRAALYAAGKQGKGKARNKAAKSKGRGEKRVKNGKRGEGDGGSLRLCFGRGSFVSLPSIAH